MTGMLALLKMVSSQEMATLKTGMDTFTLITDAIYMAIQVPTFKRRYLNGHPGTDNQRTPFPWPPGYAFHAIYMIINVQKVP